MVWRTSDISQLITIFKKRNSWGLEFYYLKLEALCSKYAMLYIVFTALHYAEQYYTRAFRPSFWLSVKCVNCDKTKETSPKILIPYKRHIHLVFWQEKWLMGMTQCTWNFGRNADFQSIFARSSSAVTQSEKSLIITNKKSTTRFQMSLRWTAYVASKPQRGLKNAKWPFLSISVIDRPMSCE